MEDSYVQRAQKEGVRSRSAYKLKEVVERYKLIRPNDIVVDLGSSPGGWSEVAVKSLGPSGHLVAIDLLHMDAIDNVTFLQGDFTDASTQETLVRKIEEVVNRGDNNAHFVNVVLSDMLHNMTGHKQTDHFKSMDLVHNALEFAKLNLAPHPSSSFFVKLLRGEDEKDFLTETRRVFDKVQVLKPGASRRDSTEMYVLARGKKSSC